ncbi:MAG: divalent cation tolerance protein CutA [Roseivirga sp.]|nr:divalent cation tolerance protein CutA [Roseivirga sp.]
MVLLHIICNDRQQSAEIADLLVTESLVLSAVTFQSVSVKEKQSDGSIGQSEQTLLIGRTRGILFNTVEARLREVHGAAMPVIYSVPIVNMNWKDADVLAETATEYED